MELFGGNASRAKHLLAPFDHTALSRTEKVIINCGKDFIIQTVPVAHGSALDLAEQGVWE